MKKILKKAISVLLLSLCLVMPITLFSNNYNNAAYAQSNVTFGGTIKVNSGYVNVRKGPGANYPTTNYKLYNNDSIRMDDRSGNWVHITYPTTGWVCDDYVVHFNYND